MRGEGNTTRYATEKDGYVHTIMLSKSRKGTTFMKQYTKRLVMILIAAAIMISSVAPNGEQAAAASKFKTQTITIRKTKQVVDSLDGVKAYYRKGRNDGSSKFYSCAAFVKRYYKKVYGVDVRNLYYNRTPHTDDDKFVKVTEPQVGDIVANNTNHGTTHWAIVKKVNKNTVTLIEQNWKWNQSGSTLSVRNRKVKIKKVRFYRLKSEVEEPTVSITVNE